MAELARGIALVSSDNGDRSAGYTLLSQARSAAVGERFSVTFIPVVDLHIAAEKARTDDIDGAITLLRDVIAEQLETGSALYLGAATSGLVESLLARGRELDLSAAQDAIEALAGRADRPWVCALPIVPVEDAGSAVEVASRHQRLSEICRRVPGLRADSRVRRSHGSGTCPRVTKAASHHPRRYRVS
jgi:hypothetical protein